MILKYVTRIFLGERLEWELELPPERVLQMIARTNEGTWTERLFAPGISTSTGKNKFELSKMTIGNLPFSGNAFVHVLSGRILETSTGAKVTARFRLAIPYFVFITVWLGGLFLIGILGGSKSLIDAFMYGDIHQISKAAIMFCAPAIGTLILNLFKMLGAGNEREIKAKIIEVLGNPLIK